MNCFIEFTPAPGTRIRTLTQEPAITALCSRCWASGPRPWAAWAPVLLSSAINRVNLRVRRAEVYGVQSIPQSNRR